MSAAQSILKDKTQMTRQRHFLLNTQHQTRSRADCMPTRTSALPRSKIPGTGTDYLYGERAATLEAGEQIARRRQEALDC